MSLGMHPPAAPFPKLRGPPCPPPPSLVHRRNSPSFDGARPQNSFAMRSTEQDWKRETEKELKRTQQELERRKLMEVGQPAGNNKCREKNDKPSLHSVPSHTPTSTMQSSSVSTGRSFQGVAESKPLVSFTPPGGRTWQDSAREYTHDYQCEVSGMQTGTAIIGRGWSGASVHEANSPGLAHPPRGSPAVKLLDRPVGGAPLLASNSINQRGVPLHSRVDSLNVSSHNDRRDELVTQFNQVLALTMPQDNGGLAKEFEGNAERTPAVKTLERPLSDSSVVSTCPGRKMTPRSKSAMPAIKQKELKKDVNIGQQLVCSMKDVLVVDNLCTARTVVCLLKGKYRHLVHACDTEVANIDVKRESPLGHGKVICFSIYCGAEADFGDGKSCIWVDVLDGGEELLEAFRGFFEDASIKKVWHNFSFDRHVLANHGVKAAGFYADTMHLARLWNSGRKGAEGGYSLESLTSDVNVMNGVGSRGAKIITKKTSMKDLFGVNNVRKDGTEGKIKVIPLVEEIQKTKSLREKWICYSAGDAICTWRLWESLREKLKDRKWASQNKESGNMYDFYCNYWQPFGELLVAMEAEGMLVDRNYLAEIGQIAFKERLISINRFRKWAARYCLDAEYINVTSDSQIRQLLFGGFYKVDKCRTFQVPNINGYIEEGKKVPKKSRPIEICGIGVELPCETFSSGGLPGVSIRTLKSLAGKIRIEVEEKDPDDFVTEDVDETAMLTSAGIEGREVVRDKEAEDLSLYGAAYHAFNGGEGGKEACKAIAALCEVSAIDTLISSFIQPLQGGDILGLDGRVHCSLNLNTETGRLSARRPSLQNQPALEKDRYKIRQAFIASPGKSLIVADYGQLELRLLAHLANCRSMLEAFKIGGDFHSRTAMNMYDHVKRAVENGEVILEWEPKEGVTAPPRPLLKDVFGAERRKAKMLNFSIAYGKTAKGLANDWKVTLDEAQATVELWYRDRHEVRQWQERQKTEARENQCVYTLLGRARHFPDVKSVNLYTRGHIDRAAINTPVQGSAADVAMLAMLEIADNSELKRLGWKLVLQVHDEVILEGPTESADVAKQLVVRAMSHPFKGRNILNVELAVDAKYAKSWYAAK